MHVHMNQYSLWSDQIKVEIDDNVRTPEIRLSAGCLSCGLKPDDAQTIIRELKKALEQIDVQQEVLYAREQAAG